MQGTVAITDVDWYETLRRLPDLDEVNFWKPSATRTFRAPEFSPFLFKLKAQHGGRICGFGFFARYARLPDWLAWECFERKNGCDSLEAMRQRIGLIRERIRFRGPRGAVEIGCVLVVQPVLFPPEACVDPPRDWPVRTQTDKKPVLVKPRLGQGTFRVAVTEAYERGCAVTGEHSLPALEAAHILPYRLGGPHEIRNGILLRADLHRLFDKGYVAVTPKMRFEVSRRLRDDYENGRSYYPLHGREVRPPQDLDLQPDRERLSWHCEHVFLG